MTINKLVNEAHQNAVEKGWHKDNPTFPAEFADMVIRVFDACWKYGIDLEKAIELKMAYNKTRPYKYGNKRI